MISTKGRYALLVMVDLAEHRGNEYVPLRDIAERGGISEKYLESILKPLVQGKLVVGLRGKGGGYRLVRRPEKVSVGQVLRLEEETLAPVACLSDATPTCKKSSSCPTLPMWEKLNTMINEFFDGISITDLCEMSQDPKEAASRS